MGIQAIQVRKKVKSWAGNIIVKYPPINSKIIEEVTLDGHFDKSINTDILNTFMEFVDYTIQRGNTARIPYVGSFKKKPWLKDIETDTVQDTEEDAAIYTK